MWPTRRQMAGEYRKRGSSWTTTEAAIKPSCLDGAMPGAIRRDEAIRRRGVKSSRVVHRPSSANCVRRGFIGPHKLTTTRAVARW